MKARTILGQTYGSIFVNFARPVSVREMVACLEGPTLRNRLTHTLTPAFIFELSPPQNRTIESLSYLTLIDMLRQQVVQPISIIATCLLMSFRYGEIAKANQIGNTDKTEQLFLWRRSISLEALCYQLDNLKRILINLGAKVNYFTNGRNIRIRIKINGSWKIK